MLKRKGLPSRLEMAFEGGLTEVLTSHAGVSLLIELGRVSGVMAAVAQSLPAKKSSHGLAQDQFVESFVVITALGGECPDDFDHLRLDRGLEAMLGYKLPAAPTAR